MGLRARTLYGITWECCRGPCCPRTPHRGQSFLHPTGSGSGYERDRWGKWFLCPQTLGCAHGWARSWALGTRQLRGFSKSGAEEFWKSSFWARWLCSRSVPQDVLAWKQEMWAALRADLSILSLLANAAPKCQFSFNKTLTMTRLSPHTLGRKKEHVPGGELAEVRGKIRREAGMERPQSPPAQAFLQALGIVHELQVRACW